MYMECSNKKFRRAKHLRIDTENGKAYQFEEVENFTYMRTIIAERLYF